MAQCFILIFYYWISFFVYFYQIFFRLVQVLALTLWVIDCWLLHSAYLAHQPITGRIENLKYNPGANSFESSSPKNPENTFLKVPPNNSDRGGIKPAPLSSVCFRRQAPSQLNQTPLYFVFRLSASGGATFSLTVVKLRSDVRPFSYCFGGRRDFKFSEQNVYSI